MILFQTTIWTYCREVIKSAGATLLRCMLLNSPTIIEDNLSTPTLANLYQNYPNPFNPTTRINYEIPERSFITLKVYDVLGNEVAALVNEDRSIGNYTIEFDATTLPSGIYFYRLQAGSFVETKKMILMK